MTTEQWISYLPGESKQLALADYQLTKQDFIDTLRVSSTCPYIQSSDSDPAKPILTADGYYVTPFQPGDSPDYHAKFHTKRHKKMLRYYGWTDEEFNLTPIEYKTNKNGFRDEHFSNEAGIACFGCSNTFGTGIHAHQTWPSQLSKLTGQKTWNLGTPALGLEPATLYATKWLNEDLPNLSGIAIFVPPMGRAIRVIPELQSTFAKYKFGRWRDILAYADDMPLEVRERVASSIPATSQLVTEICIRTLKMMAEMKNIPFAVITTEEITAKDWARDLQHRGPETMKKLARQFAHILDKYNYESS